MRRHLANTKITLIEQKQLAKSWSGGVTSVAWEQYICYFTVEEERRCQTTGPGGDRWRQREGRFHLVHDLPLVSSLLSSLPASLFSSLYPLPPCLFVWLAHSLAGHLHGVGDRADSLGAVRVGAGPRAGPIHGASAGQGGCPGASQSGHTGRGHWEGTGRGALNFANKQQKANTQTGSMTSWC